MAIDHARTPAEALICTFALFVRQYAGMGEHPVPWRILNAVAPIRICDLGGWTDTWFAEHGKVFNIGVHPGVEVQVNDPLAPHEQFVMTLGNNDMHNVTAYLETLK